MKILILNWRDIRHPLSGGAEISLLEHAKYWQKKKADIIWFSSHFAGAKNKENIDGITYIRKGTHFTVHLWAFFYFISNRLGKPDIVIDSFHFLPFFTPLYMRKNKIVGLINEVAGKVWFDNLFPPFALLGYFLEPRFFLFYKKVIFLTGSNSTKDELITLGLSPQQINVVHHGIHTVRVAGSVKKERDLTLVFLGRVSADKGITDTLKVYKEVKKTVANCKLWIIGKEEKPGIIDMLMHAIRSKEVRKDITYFGFVSEEKKFQLLKKAWLLIHPSKKEGWGLNVIEAATQGTPTIGYNVAGLRDSVRHKKTGILVDKQEPSLLVQAILDIIVDKSMKTYHMVSRNAIQWSSNFNWTNSTSQSWNVIRKIYDDKK